MPNTYGLYIMNYQKMSKTVNKEFVYRIHEKCYSAIPLEKRRYDIQQTMKMEVNVVWRALYKYKYALYTLKTIDSFMFRP